MINTFEANGLACIGYAASAHKLALGICRSRRSAATANPTVHPSPSTLV